MKDFNLQTGNILNTSMLIDGKWITTGTNQISVENPATEEVIATIPNGTAETATQALEVAQRAHPAWAATPAIQRAKYILALAEAVEKREAEYARLICLEQGKPLTQAHGEVGASIAFLRYAAGNARRIEGDILTSDNPNEEIQIRRHPYGVVVGLTAWNYPAALAARKLGPALVAGNCFVLLSHECTPLSGLFLAYLAQEIGFPPGVFNVVTGYGSIVGQALIESPLSNLVTMTGSTRAGKQIYKTAADTLKNVRLELGGKAPFIVLEDANIDRAVDAAIAARYTNCGQICTCNERMYIHHSVADEFSDKFIARSKALTIGDPFQNPDIGPKVNGQEIIKIAQLVEQACQEGAEILLEGGILNEGAYAKGHWYAPTVLAVSDNQSPLMQQEIFGPVAPILRIESFEQAVSFANESAYGLSAYVFTQKIDRLMRTPTALKFGEIYFNRANGEQVHGFHSGWGQSGLGGEDGKYGFDGYLQKQSLYLNWE